MKLIIVLGLPGTGKTTFASALATAINAKHLNSDMVRDSFGKRGHYDVSSKDAIYNEMLKQTEEYIQSRDTVIIDATFYKENLRLPYSKLSEKYNVPIFWIELKAEESEIQKRVGKKRKYSEADFEVYLKIKKSYEPLTYERLVLWSDQLSLEEMVEKTMEFLRLKSKKLFLK